MTSIKVCKYFIKSSPVGELQDVLDDISNIIGNDFLSHPDIKDALRDYYETHKLHVPMQDGSTVIVSQPGRQQPIVKYEQSNNPGSNQQPPKKTNLFEGDDDYGQEQQ